MEDISTAILQKEETAMVPELTAEIIQQPPSENPLSNFINTSIASKPEIIQQPSDNPLSNFINTSIASKPHFLDLSATSQYSNSMNVPMEQSGLQQFVQNQSFIPQSPLLNYLI
eukprot:UN00922